jgi:hypothetical protein
MQRPLVGWYKLKFVVPHIRSIIIFVSITPKCIAGSTVLSWEVSFSKQLQSFVLTDIDECQPGNLCMHGQCKNTEGSFRCTCGQGYQLSAAKDQCEGRTVEHELLPFQLKILLGKTVHSIG